MKTSPTSPSQSAQNHLITLQGLTGAIFDVQASAESRNAAGTRPTTSPTGSLSRRELDSITRVVQDALAIIDMDDMDVPLTLFHRRENLSRVGADSKRKQ